jgi:Ca2+-transporting ATPase
MLVTAVGVESSGGKIQAMLSQTEDDMTPLQEKLKHVAVLIGKAGVAAGITTFLSLGTRWAISYATLKPLSDTYCHGVKTSYDATSALARLAILSKEFVIAITIVVVAVPEGLPLAVTLALSLSMFKMMKEKCFVRHLDASETMGQATTVCTDKTGTLTYNRMSVVRLQTRDHTFRGEGSGDKDAIPFSTKTLSIPMRDIVTEACCINSNCFIKNEDQVDEANATPQFVGSATEGSMLILSKKLGVKYAELREKLPAIANGVWSFSAERKRMSTMIKVHETGNYRLHTKGAPEIVCKLCTHVLDPESMKVIPLSEKELAEKQNTINKWASEGLRTIAIAYRDYDHPLDSSKDNDVENNLTLIALLAIKDPLRKQIPQAVSTCQTAGIVVRMVTGDNLLTAIKIAKEANICFGDGICIEGPKFREMSKEEKIAILPKLQVKPFYIGSRSLLSSR